MKRVTLQECIDFFNSNEIMKESAVRNMEQLGEWETAAVYWNKIGREPDANACLMIASVNKKGDEYRSAISHLTNWVDDSVSQGILTEEEALKIVYPEMSKIHKGIM